jgi:hypothetical protein
MQIASFLLRIILSSVTCPAVPYLSPLLNKRHYSGGGGIIEPKMFSLIFSTTFFFFKFLILRRVQRGIIKNKLRFSCGVSVILAIF